MNTRTERIGIRRRWLLAMTLAGAMIGCSTIGTATTEVGIRQGTPIVVSGKIGAQLWAEHCNRCHNYRSPASLDDVQWGVAARHMRVRANLTGAEERAILEFLRAGN